jgi:hypothetical protein
MLVRSSNIHLNPIITRFRSYTCIERILIPLAIIVPCILWVNGAWPISMTSDSTDIWNQIQTNNLNDAHPLMYAYFVKFLSWNGASLVSVAIVQVLLMIFLLFKLTFLLLPRFSLKARSCLVGFLLMTPHFGAMAVTLWKDTPYAVFILLGLIYVSEKKTLSNKRFILSGLVLTIGISMRHEGSSILFILSLTILALSFKGMDQLKAKLYRKIALLIAIACFSSSTLHQVVLKLNDVQATSRSFAMSGAFAELGYVASMYPQEMSQANYNLVRTISDGASFEGLKDCRSTNGFAFSEGFKPSEFAKKWKEVLRAYVETLPTGWNHYLYSHICRTANFLPPPISIGPGYRSWTVLNIYELNPQGLKNASPIPPLRDLLLAWRQAWESRSSLVAWPGLFLMLFLMLRSRFRDEIKEADGSSDTFTILSLMIVMQWLFLAIFAGAQDTRYANIIIWVTSVMVLGRLVAWASTKMKSKNVR